MIGKKVICYVLSLIDENHFCSNGLIMQKKQFMLNKNLFEKFDFKIIFLDDFAEPITRIDLDKQSNAIINFLKHIKTISNEKIYLYCISHGFHSILHVDDIINNKNIVKILFTDDPHAYFLNETKLHTKTLFYDKNKNPQFYGDCLNKNVSNKLIDLFELILTPSITFFKNINYKNNNIFTYNYCYDENLDMIINENKLKKILLSGAINDAVYPLRKIINDKLNDNNSIYIELFEKLEHCGYDNNDNKKISGYKYLKKISEYQGAIADCPIFPLGYPVYKHIEILLSGSVGFFLEDNALYELLGLKKYIHYFPLYIDEIKKEIKNIKEIKTFLNSYDYHKIKINGQKFAIENYGSLISCQKFLNFTLEDKIYYQTNIDVTLNLLILGKSLVRFGDGDFLLLMGKSVITQTKPNFILIEKMKNILLHGSTNIMIGIPPWFINYYDYHFDTDNKKENDHYTNFYEKYKNFINGYISHTRIYHDACIFRPFKIEKYKKKVENVLINLIHNKNICLICNHNTTISHPYIKYFFANVKHIKFIHVDNIDAFENNYNIVVETIKLNIKNIDIILIAAGPMRVLVNDFSDKQIIDIGSFFGIF